MQKVYSFMWWNMCLVSFESWELILQFVSSGLMKLDETIGYCWCPIVMNWSLYGCNNDSYGCTIVMSYIEINKAVSQWLLTFNLCVSVTWPLTCAFHIPCTYTLEIIDMHRGVCDNIIKTHVRGFFDTDLHEVSWHFATHEAIRPSGF